MSAGLLVVFPLIIFVFVLAGVVVAKGVRAAQREQSDGGENVIKTVYVYVVLFATLMMTIGGTVGAFMAIADLVAPASYYQGFDEYLRSSKEPAGGQTTINIEEAKKQYEQLAAEQKAWTRERAVNSLIKSFGWIVIPLPVFIYFQRRVKGHPVT